ncbi:SCP2 sterol-binding domain-containing protein [Bacillus alkalicellulosilyticus]|uniref:SCP2 sterol-binding domain-containing protein n=1 Tax=Alkalihalobacterium alkalicellulosilyticum TaxID=1912214 RepID=UPI000998598A|nr:SCP2 sterol-binding domain-containing protein [Bacillus alkalicellulosilyticus]
MAVREALEQVKQKMNDDPKGIEGVSKTYQFDLSGEEEGTIQITFKEGTVDFFDEIKEEPVCTLSLSDENFLKLINGGLNPTMAFMSGKLKIKGELGHALKLQSILSKYQ